MTHKKKTENNFWGMNGTNQKSWDYFWDSNLLGKLSNISDSAQGPLKLNLFDKPGSDANYKVYVQKDKTHHNCPTTN